MEDPAAATQEPSCTPPSCRLGSAHRPRPHHAPRRRRCRHPPLRARPRRLHHHLRCQTTHARGSKAILACPRASSAGMARPATSCRRASTAAPVAAAEPSARRLCPSCATPASAQKTPTFAAATPATACTERLRGAVTRARLIGSTLRACRPAIVNRRHRCLLLHARPHLALHRCPPRRRAPRHRRGPHRSRHHLRTHLRHRHRRPRTLTLGARG